MLRIGFRKLYYILPEPLGELKVGQGYAFIHLKSESYAYKTKKEL
jgi:hypothetical protein